MTITETAPADAVVPTFKAEKPRRSNTGLIVGIIVGGLMLMMILPFAAIIALRAGDSIGQSESGVIVVDDATVVDEATVVDPIAYKYFGDVSIAQGSTVTTMVVGEFINSPKDVEIIDMTASPGLEAAIFEGDGEGVLLELNVAEDMQVGAHHITFKVAGEPELIDWVFTVLPR